MCAIALLLAAVTIGATLGAAGRDGGDSSGSDGSQTSAQPTPTPDPNKRSPRPPTGSGGACGAATAACSFVDRFVRWNRTRWSAADGIANGAAFGSWWDRNRVSFSEDSGLTLSLVRSSHLGKNYASGQLLSNVWFEYGCIEASIRPASRIG